MPTHHDIFLEDILSNPDDDTPRLIYADWLLEQGDPRGELIAVQCRLAELGDSSGEESRVLQKREASLLDEHRDSWSKNVSPNVQSCEFERGFIGRILVNFSQLQHSVADLHRVAPLRSVVLSVNADDVGELAQTEQLKHVTELEIHGYRLGDDLVSTLLESPHLAKIERLFMHHCGLGPRSAEAIAAGPLQHLRSLNLGANDLGDDGMGTLCSSATLDRLEILGVGGNELYGSSATALAQSESLQSLREINLGANYLGNIAVMELAASSNLSQLTNLDLRYNEFSTDGARFLAESETLHSLRRLDVTHNSIEGEGRRALLERFGDRVKLD